MIDVFRFLMARSMRNRMTRRLRRLREVRYLVPTVISVGWFVFWVSRSFVWSGPSFNIGTLPTGTRDGFALVGSLFLLAWTAFLWLVPSKSAALEFSPAEIHFLFTAPVTRRQIVHYKLLRAQFGILFGAIITAFFWGGRLLQPEGWARLAAFWLLFGTMHLHAMGAAFTRTSLIEHGVSGLRRRIVPLLLLALFLGGGVVSALQARPLLQAAGTRLFDASGDLSWRGVQEFLEVMSVVGTRGVMGVLLWPFRVLPELVLSHGVAEFVAWFGAALLLLVLHYLWVVRSDASFEEASVEAAQRRAVKLSEAKRNVRRGGRLAAKATVFPWRLSPRGRPEVAVTWKNLVSLTRVTPVRALIVLAAFILAILGWTVGLAETGTPFGLVAAILLGSAASFSALFGPVFVRNDLREDMFRVDILKTFPLPGHSIVWAEILGPWVVLAAFQVLALLLAAGMMIGSGVTHVEGLTLDWVLAIVAAALLVLPAITLAALALQNGLVLMFPAWVALGNSRARGFEASGQRMLNMAGTFVVMGFVTLPAAFAGGVAAWLTERWLGATALILGAVLCSIWILAETAFGTRLLGRLLDRLDPSTAGIEAQEE